MKDYALRIVVMCIVAALVQPVGGKCDVCIAVAAVAVMLVIFDVVVSLFTHPRDHGTRLELDSVVPPWVATIVHTKDEVSINGKGTGLPGETISFDGPHVTVDCVTYHKSVFEH